MYKDREGSKTVFITYIMIFYARKFKEYTKPLLELISALRKVTKSLYKN